MYLLVCPMTARAHTTGKLYKALTSKVSTKWVHLPQLSEYGSVWRVGAVAKVMVPSIVGYMALTVSTATVIYHKLQK